MKLILTIVLFSIGLNSFSQKLTPQDSAKLAATVPILSENDLNEILSFLDDKLLSKDHRLVTQTISTAVLQARKRKTKNK